MIGTSVMKEFIAHVKSRYSKPSLHFFETVKKRTASTQNKKIVDFDWKKWYFENSGILTEKQKHGSKSKYSFCSKKKFSITDFFSKCDQICENCGFSHISWRNPAWITSFFVNWVVLVISKSIKKIRFSEHNLWFYYIHASNYYPLTMKLVWMNPVEANDLYYTP